MIMKTKFEEGANGKIARGSKMAKTSILGGIAFFALAFICI